MGGNFADSQTFPQEQPMGMSGINHMTISASAEAPLQSRERQESGFSTPPQKASTRIERIKRLERSPVVGENRILLSPPNRQECKRRGSNMSLNNNTANKIVANTSTTQFSRQIM